MCTYSNRLQPALQNLLQHVVQFFHPRSSCTTTHISADVQRITLNASCMTIADRRTKQLHICCRVTGFTNDFLSFIVVELIWFFHGALQLIFTVSYIIWITTKRTILSNTHDYSTFLARLSAIGSNKVKVFFYCHTERSPLNKWTLVKFILAKKFNFITKCSLCVDVLLTQTLQNLF